MVANNTTPPNILRDELILCAVQPPLRPDHVSPLESAKQAIQLMRETASNQAPIDLFCLPELSPIGYTQDTFENWLPITRKQRQVHEEIHECMAKVAVELQAYICFGTIGIVDQNGTNRFTIRQVVLDSFGTVVAQYDKISLCDYGDCSETRYFVPGKSLSSFDLHGYTIGMIICADMRNPTLSRRLVSKHHADLILQPAAFARDVSFYTWRSFCITRSVENSVYFCGINYAGDYYGESIFCQPWVDQDHEPTVMGTECGVMISTVKRATLQHVRNSMPFYKRLFMEKEEPE